MRRATLGLLHLDHGRPAEISALGALGILEVLEAIAPRDTRGSTLEALDGDRVHVGSIGAARDRRFPCSGDGRMAAPDWTRPSREKN
jgi:hypothetical protein